MSWADLPRSGFLHLPSDETCAPAPGYVTGTQVMDRLIAIRWGAEALHPSGALDGEQVELGTPEHDTIVNERVIECVGMLVSAAEAERILGFVESRGKMRLLLPPDWSERTLSQWEYDLLDSTIERGHYDPTAWANGKTLMFERQAISEWLQSLPSPYAPPDPLTRDPVALPANSAPGFSRPAAERAYRKRVETWPENERHPSREDDEKWLKKNFGVPRDIAREIRRKLAPQDWSERGAPKTTS